MSKGETCCIEILQEKQYTGCSEVGQSLVYSMDEKVDSSLEQQ